MKYLQIFGTWKYFNLETTSARSAVVSFANLVAINTCFSIDCRQQSASIVISVDEKFFLDFLDIVIDIFFCIDCGTFPVGASIAQWQSVGLVNQRS